MADDMDRKKVSKEDVKKQLARIGFNHGGWGRTEAGELHNILLPGEEIYECVNGIYEGGFALMVATDVRVLLVDKKPLNYLTVEDMRFDMISEMDYSHRLFGAEINISSGGKLLKFRSYNQHRLRKLIGHVQHCMAQAKKKQSTHQDSQVSHLEQINKQLQAYLIAQYQYQQELHEKTAGKEIVASNIPEPPKPSNELADYLYAQSLLAQYRKQTGEVIAPPNQTVTVEPVKLNEDFTYHDESSRNQMQDIYNEGVKEVFGGDSGIQVFNTNPEQIAFSKLPAALRAKQAESNPA